MIIFGAGKLTDVGSALGRGIKEFKAPATGEEHDAAISADAVGKGERRRIEPRALRADLI